MKYTRWLIIGFLCIFLAAVPTAFSQVAEQSQGAGNFLNGYWTLSATGSSGTVLLNPTGKDRDAVVLFYDDEERFLTCDVRRLTPHDMEIIRFPILLRDFCSTFPETCAGGRIVVAEGGHMEVRSEPADFSGKPGINGYVIVPGGGAVIASSSPLFVLDPGLFQVEAKDAPRIMQCACPRLKTLHSPLEPLFCGQ